MQIGLPPLNLISQSSGTVILWPLPTDFPLTVLSVWSLSTVLGGFLSTGGSVFGGTVVAPDEFDGMFIRYSWTSG